MSDFENKETKKLKSQVEDAFQRIEKTSDAQALKNIHENIQRHATISDLDRERLTEAVILRLRMISPALATHLGGPKDAEARDFLQKLLERVASKFDLSGNTVGKGVKTGGDMINGTRFVDVYLSYKTAEGKNLSFAWIQDTAESEPYLELLIREVGKNGAGELLREKFTNQDEGIERYLSEIEKLIGSPRTIQL